MRETRHSRESLPALLLGMVGQFKTQSALASTLGISSKTLARLINQRTMPAPARRPAMLHALAGHVEHELLMRLGDALDVSLHLRPHAHAAPTTSTVYTSSLEDALELSLFVAAERHGVPLAQARRLSVDVMARAHALGVPTAAAHAALVAIAARREPQ